MIRCKRAYLAPLPEDGPRILVDRLWPRGCSKAGLQLAKWIPEVAPSAALREAFHSGSLKFADFSGRYRDELAASPVYWWPVVDLALYSDITLVYAARSNNENNAVVLAQWLEEEIDRRNTASSAVCYRGDLATE